MDAGRKVGNRFKEGLTSRLRVDSPDWGTSRVNPSYLAFGFDRSKFLGIETAAKAWPPR